tara:strand:+ start:10 stop:288 length:279 start_codon:yes stop_codon:yes gene_type:complete
VSQLNNKFDELGAQPEWSDDDKTNFERLDYLIHKTFKQTPEGMELLELWEENLLMAKGFEFSDNDLTIGHKEGVKSFIRNIILTIRKVENDE